MARRRAAYGSLEKRHVGKIDTEQVVGKNPVARCQHAAASIEDENRRAAEVVVQLLQEAVGRRLRGGTLFGRRAQQRQDFLIELDCGGDRRMARDLAVDGCRQHVELMAGGLTHTVDGYPFGQTVGAEGREDENQQAERQPQRAMRAGQRGRNPFGGRRTFSSHDDNELRNPDCTSRFRAIFRVDRAPQEVPLGGR